MTFKSPALCDRKVANTNLAICVITALCYTDWADYPDHVGGSNLAVTGPILLMFDFSERFWIELSCLVLRLMIQ